MVNATAMPLQGRFTLWTGSGFGVHHTWIPAFPACAGMTAVMTAAVNRPGFPGAVQAT